MEPKELIKAREILEGQSRFFLFLQVHCVALCCGIDAFSFEPKDIQNAMEKTNSIGIIEDFESVIRMVENCDVEEVSHTVFNQVFKKTEFLDLMQDLLAKVLELEKNKLN